MFVKSKILELKEKVKDQKVLCALSGGVDSSVAASLLSSAVGSNLTCIFVDHGLLRKDEVEEVVKTFGNREDVILIKLMPRIVFRKIKRM